MVLSSRIAIFLVLVAAALLATSNSAHGKDVNESEAYGLNAHYVDWNIDHALNTLSDWAAIVEYYNMSLYDDVSIRGVLKLCNTATHATIQDAHNAKSFLGDIDPAHPTRKSSLIFERVQIYLASCLFYIDDCNGSLGKHRMSAPIEEQQAFDDMFQRSLDPRKALQTALNLLPDKFHLCV